MYMYHRHLKCITIVKMVVPYYLNLHTYVHTVHSEIWIVGTFKDVLANVRFARKSGFLVIWKMSA